MTTALDGNQRAAFDKLSRLKVGAAFMTMGSGKTLTAFRLVAGTNADLCVWIAPCSTLDDIRAEYAKWDQAFPVEFIGCQTISQSDGAYYALLRKIQGRNVFLVVDESLTIKNREAIRTQRITEIGRHCAYRLILNGTPVSKNYLDLWAQMEFLSPKILGMTYRVFRDKFAEYYVRGRLKGMVRKYHNIPYLMRLIEPYVFHCDLELDVNKNHYDYHYENENAGEYGAIKERYLRQAGNSRLNVIPMFNELQRCYTNSIDKQKMIDEITGNGEQFIVFAAFLDNIKGENKITGDMDKERRREVRRRFMEGEFNVLWITYGTGSYGLNLQFCHNIIFADQTFDYGKKLQAEYRIFRKGQTEPVHYYNLWCKTGLESMMKASLGKKSDMLTTVKEALARLGERGLVEQL